MVSQANEGPAASVARLGKQLLQSGRYAEAANLYQRAMVTEPGSAEAHVGLGHSLYGLGRYDEALVAFESAARLEPASFEAHYWLGLTCKLRGDHERSLTHFSRALELRPDDPEILAGKAGVHERRGEYDQAYMLLRPLVEAGSLSPNVLVNFGLLASRFQCEELAIERLERALHEPLLTADHRADIGFTLGQLYDESGRYAEAFERYRVANALVKPGFNRTQFHQLVDELIRTFPSDKTSSYARASIRSELPVFIVGMPRSGTSLVEQILASHPDVFGAGEERLFEFIAAGMPRESMSGISPAQFVGSLTPAMLDPIAQRYLDHLSSRAGRKVMRITDKMPGNFMQLGLISMLFPDARVIHCMRDPRDTCLSCYFQRFPPTHAYAFDLADLGFYYREYERLMAHWRSVLDIPVLDVPYEALVRDTETWGKRLVEFVGLPWDDRCRQPHKTARTVNTASFDQVRHPVYATSVQRWRHYERSIGPLLDELGDAIHRYETRLQKAMV